MAKTYPSASYLFTMAQWLEQTGRSSRFRRSSITAGCPSGGVQKAIARTG